MKSLKPIRNRVTSCTKEELEEVVMGVIDALYLTHDGKSFVYDFDTIFYG